MLLSMLSGGYATSETNLVEADFTDEDTVLEFLTVREVASKSVAPCILPCTFKGTTAKHTKSGRRRVTDADTGTALVYDIDHGDLDEHVVESAISKLRCSFSYWTTWKAGGEHGLRWRVLLPLSRHVAPRDYEELWTKVARVIERRLIAIVGFRPEHGFIDWAARSITQPAILPCRPSGPVPPGEDPWGGISPRVVVDASLPALDPGDVPTATRAKGPDRQKVIGARAPTPYVPEPDADGVDRVIEELRQGSHGSVRPLAALNAISRLRRDGLPKGLKGTRHTVVSAVIWHIYRLGYSGRESDQAVEDIHRATQDLRDAAHVLDVGSRLLANYDRKANAVEGVASTIVDAVKDDVPKVQHPALWQYARVLARAKHLRREAGGQLDHAALAHVVGVETRALVAMRGLIEEAGLLAREGDTKATRYRLLVADQHVKVEVEDGEDEEEAA